MVSKHEVDVTAASVYDRNRNVLLLTKAPGN